MGANSAEAQLKILEPVHKYNIDLHCRQNKVLAEIAQIATEKFHLAEPSTKEQIRNLLRSHANRDAVKYEFPIDATREPIPSINRPFPPKLESFMKDVETQYNRLGAELRTAQFNDLQQSNTVLITSYPTLLALLDTPPAIEKQQEND